MKGHRCRDTQRSERSGGRAASPARYVHLESGEPTRTPLRLWMLDSGTGIDMTDKNDIPEKNRPFIQDAKEPCILETANGDTEANKTVLMQIGELQEQIEPYVREDLIL